MAEVKNSFIKSKMNKVLDARLLPNGEYREGVNIQVSRSEGADVGALENVLGNQSLIDFSSASYTGVPNLQTIGMYTNNLDNNIYIFLTDYNELNTTGYNIQKLNYSSTANNFIFVYNTNTGVANKLVSGAFLNFSTNFLINSVNMLENILFWTDNRNQPRKINVDNPLSNSNYYTTEDQLSVATYAPFEPIEVYYKDNAAFEINGGSGVTEGITLAGATAIIFDAVQFKGTLPSSKTSTALNGAIVSGSSSIPNNTVVGSFITGNTINLVDLSTLPAAGTTPSPTAVALTSDIPAGTTIYFNKNNLLTANNGQYVTSMIDANTPMNPGTAVFNPSYPASNTNRNYNPNFNGDPDFLEDKFVRFSYRFRYEDGENSIMAPFTQPTFIPKQDGYFLGEDEKKSYRSTIVSFMENKVNNIFLQIPLPLKAVPVLQNFADGTKASIYDRFNANEIGDALKISEIEILYKESDKQAIQVVDTINRDEYEILGRNTDGTFNTILSYNYQSTKPYKTLPTSELVRVYDKVPVRALGQEIIGNRVVYSNFQDKHTPIASLDYNVGVSTKDLDFVINNDPGNPVLPPLQKTSSVEYPMHTIKQNRNYQVGIVLSDKFGRSSTTILSSASTQGTDGALKLVGDTVFFPYNEVDVTSSPSLNNINAWPGDSLKILFNEPIDENLKANPITGWPGIYNGDPTVDAYNPLGWYSYKIVVKQTQQEYYNVYLPGILNGYPAKVVSPPDPVNTISTITLINDNINKVPRDLTEVGPDQQQFRSSVQLHGRVTPDNSAQPTYNLAFNPGITSDTVSSIGVQDQLLQAQATTLLDYIEVYQTDSNPLLARTTQINANNPIGSLPDSSGGGAYNIVLGIYETSPFESLIDIYYETSTVGTVVELNEAINQGNSGIQGITTGTDMSIAPNTWTFNLYEDITPGSSPTATYNQNTGTYTTVNFFPFVTDGAGVKTPVVNSDINIDSTGFSVTNGNGEIVTDKFALVKIVNANPSPTDPQSYYVKITDNTFFSYQENSNIIDSYNFSLRIENLDNPGGSETQYGIFTTITLVEKLENLIPTITCPGTIAIPVGQTGIIHTFVGQNGSADTSLNQQNLSWALVSQSPAATETGAVALIVNATTGVLSEDTGRLAGRYDIVVSLTDAGTNATTLGGTPTSICNTVINGSTGYPTVDINTSFYQIKNIIINGGPESSGFFWAERDDSGTGNVSAPNPVLGGLGLGFNRTPIPGLINNVITDQGFNKQTAQLTFTGCTNWSFFNTNRNSNISPNAQNSGLGDFSGPGIDDFDWATSYNTGGNSQTSLTTGSAYILVDYYQGQVSNVADNPSLIWPSELQYRATSTDTWQIARDVEGNQCSFGGTQVNNYTVCPDDGVFTQQEGVRDLLSKSKTFASSGPFGFDQNKSFETSLRGRSNQQSPVLQTIGSKLFVVGRNQAYRDLAGDVSLTDPNSDNPPDYMGQYRLIVRYPAGENIGVNNQEKIIPVVTATTCPPSGTYSNEATAKLNQRVVLSFGDFYTPSQLIAKYKNNNVVSPALGPIPIVQSFAYRVSDNAGYATREEAEDDSPNLSVFAREWAFKYVTQFYLDQALTTPWIPPNASESRFYAYRGFADSLNTQNGYNNINVRYGNENSNTRRNGSPVYTDPVTGAELGANHNDWNRKWSAKFDQFGKKIVRTSKPCVADLATPTANPFPGGGKTYGIGDYSIQMTNNGTGFTATWVPNASNGNFTGTVAQNAQAFARAFRLDGITPSSGNPQTVTGVDNPFYVYYGLNTIPNSPYAQIGGITLNANSQVEYIDESAIGGQQVVKVTNLANVPNLGTELDNYIWVGLN